MRWRTKTAVPLHAKVLQWVHEAARSSHPMDTPAGPKANRLLAALPDDAFARWLPALEAVDMPPGLVIYEPGQELRYVHFPVTSIVTLQVVLENGNTTEIAVVGLEGLVGISAFMGGRTASNRAIVQVAGRGFRMAARIVRDEFHARPAVTGLLLRYAQAAITQMAQTAVCNRHHSVAQQLCRLLLLCRERLPDDEIALTHESIAGMIGVRREGVTAAARALQAAGIIRYTRGHIRVLDRAGLERLSCECYGVVRNEYGRLLPGTPGERP